MEFSAELILALTAVAMAAGFVDSIAGGGGLLTVPVLLLSGMDPVSALATIQILITVTFVYAARKLMGVRIYG